ncbi:MAG: S-methyl-5-thioribose-1-phosphate isomerase [Pseudomonadota bacterium]|nr:S-methyl-5-thioribose-1-phosphate isomerase [Burkholderiales bacterium]MDQ3195091.1 S-methyl-5-thioribose-1-phosphate isomerase [Pseudomonadota bacterium]
MTPGKVETLRWRDDHLEMIDQRVLPARFEYVGFDSAADVALGIRDMVVRGAPAIGCAAAYGIALEARRLSRHTQAEFSSALNQGFDRLLQSRPTAVNLGWALDRMRRAWNACLCTDQAMPPDAIAERLLIEAHAIKREDIAVNQAIGAHGAALIADRARILTHCNAGALATAGHGTALGVIRTAFASGKRISVIADETRPFLQGARLTAWEMVQENIPVMLIADSSAGHMMSRGEVDLVIVGADRVAANGDVANKIGTYTVAVLAARHAIPFYVAAPLSTIDLATASGAQIPIEERASSEIAGFGDVRWACEGAVMRNPAFDVTPAELISGLITEKGVVRAPDERKIRALFNRGSS